MCVLRYLLIFALPVLVVHDACAVDFGFSGTWTIDLRTAEQKLQQAECGQASFVLKQIGKKITGSHSMATVGCGRMNEDGDGTVKGQIFGKKALLYVTSGRNGAVVKGSASLSKHGLYWQTMKQIKAGQPAGDSPLILNKGLFSRSGV